jgi:hypothetical protein
VAAIVRGESGTSEFSAPIIVAEDIIEGESSLQILKGGREARWKDVDGDLVSVRSNKPIFARVFYFAVDPVSMGEHLVVLNLTEKPMSSGANLIFHAEPMDGWETEAWISG